MALKIGDKLIDFKLKNVDGQIISSSDYAYKNAVGVIFSCNHCPYVLAWEDRLIQIQVDYTNAGVQLILINANDAVKYPADSLEKMQEQAQKKGYPFPYLHDETQEVARAYGAERTPEVFLFDKDGRLAYHGAPDDNYADANAVNEHYLRNALDAVLAGTEPKIRETPAQGCTIKWK